MKDDRATPGDPDGESSATGQRPAEEQQRAARLARRPATRFDLSPGRDRSLLEAVAGTVPGIGVLRRYRRSWLRSDVYAGIAVVAYMVPQVMAYTALVGVPPVAGLWTALAALLVYAALGSSRVLSVGPESTIALMAGTAIAPLAGADPDRAVALAAALSLIVGGWCLVGRLARLGVISDLLSQPLLVGYLAGAAVLMIVGQLGKMTGTTVEGANLVAQLRSFASVVDDTDLLTLAVGVGTLAVLMGINFLRPRWPATLIAVVAATVVCVLADLKDHGVAVVGAVPTGLPTPGLPDVTWEELRTLVMAGLGIAVIGYGDCMLIARAFPAPVEDGEPAGEQIDPQQELTALAGVHVAAGLMSGFPVSSSGSRTALAIAARARTQLYSLVAAAFVILVLFVAGPLIENLPQASLAAVVFYAASTLVSWHELVRLARFRTTEVLLAVTAALGTVFFGVLVGVGVAIALSLIEVLIRLARPHEGVLGRVPGLAGMHDVDDYPDAETLPGLVVYRYDAPLFFANVGDMRRRALLAVDQENTAFPEHPVRWFVLNVEANVEVDITAADGLRQLHDELATRGVRLALARVKTDLRIPLERAGLTDLLGENMLFPTLPVAEEAYQSWAASNPIANGEHDR
ncbi:MAG TPA: sulfate permease [Ilumatobacteraceae bacterium]